MKKRIRLFVLCVIMCSIFSTQVAAQGMTFAPCAVENPGVNVPEFGPPDVESYDLRSAMAKSNTSFTASSLLKFVKKYDPDGYYILNRQKKRGDNILEWFMPGQGMASSGLDTAVHEETHMYSMMEPGRWGVESIYVGNNKKIDVKYTTVFRSKEMAKTIPSSMRTFRFDTYIGNPVPNLASNELGIYGILNEFTAYYWGSHAMMSLKPYFEKKVKSPDGWYDYINSLANSRVAYAEFRYYTLHYLYYAKKHYPQVYKGIMNNKNFKKAFNTVEKKFAAQNTAFEKHLKALVKSYNAKGIPSVLTDDYIWIGNSIMGTMKADYNKLMKEMKKQKYQTILKALRS